MCLGWSVTDSILNLWKAQTRAVLTLDGLGVQYLHPPGLSLTVRHMLVECNHLAQTRTDIFGRCGVVESFQFHPELVLNILRDSEFYSKL